MSTYSGKNKRLVKNAKSQRYDVAKIKKRIAQRQEPLNELKNKDDISEDIITQITNFQDSLNNIINIIAPNEPIVLDGEHKARIYIQQPNKVAPKEKSTVEKELSNVDKMYKNMGDSLFKNIVSFKEQTPDELQKSNIKQLEKINYSMNTTKANMTFQTVDELLEDVKKGASVVAYDLETYGGLSSDTKMWTPQGITEFSFQELDVKKYWDSQGKLDITDERVLTKKTAVVGITKKERDNLLSEITAELDKHGTIKDERLRVTAKRMQMYGYATFSEVNDSGITTVLKFPGDEVFAGGYDINKIKEGLDKLVKVRNDAIPYKKNGLLPYHEALFSSVADIMNNNKIALDFNGMNFDQSVMNGIMNSILKNEYNNDKEALNTVKSMFNNGIIAFNPKRIDAMGVFKEASAITGTRTVYGKNASIVAGDISKNRLHRQEILMEGFQPELMKGMDRHKAEDDTTNLLRAAFERLSDFDDQSPFENAFDIIKKDRENIISTENVEGIRKGKIVKNHKFERAMTRLEQKIDNKMKSLEEEAKKKGIKLNMTREEVKKIYGYEIDESKVGKKIFVTSSQLKKKIKKNYEITQANLGDYIFESRGELSSEGRDVLDFTYDKVNNTFRTKNGRIIGGADEVSKASGGVVNAGFKTGGSSLKGATYKFGGAYKVRLTDEELDSLIDIAPEYANKDLFVLRMDPFFMNEQQREQFKEYDNPIFRIFSSADKLEAALSNDFKNIGTDIDNKITLNKKDDFNLNKIDGNEIKAVEVKEGLSDAEILEKHISNFYNKRSNETGQRHFDTKTASRSLSYNNLKKAIKETTGAENVDMNAHLKEARRISEAISRGEDMTTDKQYGIYSLVKQHLGFEDFKNTNKQQLYSNTLNNYIRTTEQYDAVAPIVDKIASMIGETKNREELEVRTGAALDYVIDALAQEYYKEDYLLTKSKEIFMTNAEMESLYQIDLTGFQSDRRNIFKITSNLSTVDDNSIMTINLNGHTNSFVKNIRKALYGNNESKEGLDANLGAVNKFLDYLIDEKATGQTKELKALRNKIRSNKEENFSLIAEDIINILKKDKKADASKGIIRETLGKFNPLEDKGFLKYISGGVNESFIKKGIKQAPEFKMLDIDEIVDELLMPTIKTNSGKKVGKDALEHILKTNNRTSNSTKDAEIFRDHWGLIRKAHKDNMTKLSDLVTNTGGQIAIIDGTIYAKYGDEAIPFKSLAKTSYKYDTLYHTVNNSKVAAYMETHSKVVNGRVETELQSNIATITASINKNQWLLKKAKDKNDLTSDVISLFAGKISKEMRETSIISSFNIHEQESNYKIGLGKSFGEILPQLVGVNGEEGLLKGTELFDKNALKIVKEELERLGENYIGELTPQMTEALVKNFVPILDSFEGLHPLLKKYLPNISASTKDNDIGSKEGVFFHLGSDRYMQGQSTGFDAPKRPTLQAGKVDYDRDKMEAGLERYLSDKNNKDKFGMVGTIFEDKKKGRAFSGIGVENIESAITIKKANIGNVGLNAIIETNFEKIMYSNTVEKNITEAVPALKDKMMANKLFSMIQQEVSLQEQEKIMDSRLMDSVFEHSLNIQHITNKDINDFYSNKVDIQKIAEAMTDPSLSEIKRKSLMEEVTIANRISDSRIQISYVDGKIQVYTPEGDIVKRGDKILSFHDKFNPSGKISSKIDLGRFQHGVFEEKGKLRLTDEQIAKFLNNNLKIVEGESNEDLTRRAFNLLEENFKVNFFVSDIRQNVYSKFMNDAVEKDMTNGLYVGLGKLDEKVKKSLEGFKYNGKSMDIIVGQKLKVSEIENILKNYTGVTGGYDTKEELLDAIYKERNILSDILFRGMSDFRDVSIIANHQTAKHKNDGMITENIIGSVYEHFTKQENTKADPMKALKEALVKYDVFDAKTMELKSDGKAIYIKPKDGASHSKYNFDGDLEKGISVLEDVRYLRLGGVNDKGEEIGLKALIKNEAKHLYHASARVYNPSTNSIVTKELFGDVLFGSLTINKGLDSIVEENVALGSKGVSRLEQSIDPETLTSFDYDVLRALSIKRNAQRDLLDLKTNVDEYKAEAKRLFMSTDEAKSLLDTNPQEFEKQLNKYTNEYIKEYLDSIENNMIEANSILAGYEEFAAPKKIGKQEFGIYNRATWDYSVNNLINGFIPDPDTSEKALLEARQNFINKNMSAILDKDGKLRTDLEGKSAYREYTNMLIGKKMYNPNTDIAFKDEYLTLDEYKHLKKVKDQVLSVASDIGQDNVSLEYMEQIYQAKSAIHATEFNSGKNLISVKQMEQLGFEKVTIDNISLNGDTDDFLHTVFNGNKLLYLGDQFDNVGADGYLALPKAGKILEHSEITKEFQSRFKGLKSMLEEYNAGDFVAGSTYAERLKNNIIESVDVINKTMNKYVYEKGGVIHDLSTVYEDEAFRLKFSFVNNTNNLENIGDKSIQADLIDLDSNLLERAKINGTSIADLEENGIYTDYAFISKDVFERMGYYHEDKLSMLNEVRTGKINLDTDDGLRQAKELMTKHLQEDGIIANTGRYPMIMMDSEKATRIFLSDDEGGNRARVSVVTALSMNADNDGDSASFSILKARDGKDYLQYKIDMANGNKIDGSTKQFYGEIEARMAYNAIGINQYYNKQSMDDIHGELSKAIDNGTIYDTIKSIQNKSLFNEVMYANNGQLPNTEIMRNNKATLDSYVEKAQQLDASLKDLTPMDIEEINATVKTTPLAEYYDEHIKVLESASKQQLDELGLGANSIQNFKEHAIARSMWYESLEEAQSKGRKSSIGPINIALQNVRAGADALYMGKTDKDSVIKLNVANEVAYELEQEVISAKHGSVVTNLTKAKDLRKLTDNYIKESSDENKQLLLDFFNGTGESKAQNLDDKTINKIWNKLSSRGIVQKDDLNMHVFDTMDDTGAKRRFIGEQYTEVLANLKKPVAQDAMLLNKVGGSGATYRNMIPSTEIDSAGKAAAAILKNNVYEERKGRTVVNDAEEVMNRIHFSDALANSKATTAIADLGGSIGGKHLALGALSIAAGILASGYAGSAIGQVNASELARQEEYSSGGSAPMFLDQGSQVTRSSSRGYIINMKASSNRDIRQTKKALRAAASESVGGSVNVNMTIKNREVSNEDIEQWITGL